MDPSNDRELIEFLKATGHLDHPFGEDQALPADLTALTKDDPAVRQAVKSYQHFMVYVLEPLVGKHHPERKSLAPKIDGLIGPATAELLAMPRCGAPDYVTAEEAVGSGQWRQCHGLEGFHCANVKVMNDIPSHLRQPYQGGTVWDEVVRRCQKCYGEIGLKFLFNGEVANHQTELTFVPRGNGWIGLALIGQGQQCNSSPIWLRLDASYLSSREVSEQKLTLWANLLIHELGHNCGSGHTSGGIMNPGILQVANRWIGDPAENRMKSWFGGLPVPTQPDDPVPPGPPPPTTSRPIITGTVSEIDVGPDEEIVTFAIRVPKRK